MSVGVYQHDSHWTDFHEFWYWVLLRKYLEKTKFGLNWTTMLGNLFEDPSTYVLLSVEWVNEINNLGWDFSRFRRKPQLASSCLFLGPHVTVCLQLADFVKSYIEQFCENPSRISISYFNFLCWKNMIFRNHAPKFKYSPQYVIVYTMHPVHVTICPKNLH